MHVQRPICCGRQSCPRLGTSFYTAWLVHWKITADWTVLVVCFQFSCHGPVLAFFFEREYKIFISVRTHAFMFWRSVLGLRSFNVSGKLCMYISWLQRADLQSPWGFVIAKFICMFNKVLVQDWTMNCICKTKPVYIVFLHHIGAGLYICKEFQNFKHNKEGTDDTYVRTI